MLPMAKRMAESRAPWTGGLVRALAVLGAFALSSYLALQFGSAGLWQGFDPPLAAAQPGAKSSYDLTRLEAVNATLKYVRNRYVDPNRVHPREMLMSALDYIQRDVAEVIVLPHKAEGGASTGQVTVRVDTHEKKFRVDDVLGPWDVAAKLRSVFAFVQQHLRDRDIDLREVEYAACNGLLHPLDPHSVFMSPEAYKEMNLSTSGEFGGLGIVISLRDQLLTVIRPMPNTPAWREGLKRFDRIMKIDSESTLNMPLDDAVRRLRGKPGTEVTVWVAREGKEGWAGTRPFVLTRERIKVPSVVNARYFEGGVAYVRVKQFQESTTKELSKALDALRDREPIGGLVLDLRDNPGGLLKQATEVADLFLRHGMIVATVGASEGREEQSARAGGTEPPYPMVVLVNGSSASASEIVAGALKETERAIVVGQATFGKGSVQLVFPEVTRDKAALKLTIAQYLVPGDTSIQGVGVTPHIELDPMTVDELELDLTLRRSGTRERDLARYLSNQGTSVAKPAQVVRYYLSQKDRRLWRELGGELDDAFQRDFPIRFAQELVRRMPRNVPAQSQLRAATDFIETAREAEVAKVSAELGRLDVDWTVPSAHPIPGPSKSDFEVKARTDRAAAAVVAGQPMSLEVTVTNRGTEPVYRLRAKTESDNPYFDEREMVFGKIGPGESKVARAPLGWCEIEGRKVGSTRPIAADAKRVCTIPRNALARSDGLKVHFDAAGGHAPASVELRPTVRALDRPLFQYSYQIADNLRGNGDGLLQKGEQVTMYLTVKNVGKGRSFETQANLANRSGGGVLLRKGRFDISNMKPGDVRRVAFTFDVQAELEEPEVVLSLSVGDRDLREYATEKLRLPIQPPAAIDAARGVVRTREDVPLFADAHGKSAAFGVVPSGTALGLLGRAGAMSKVEIDRGRFGFVRSAALTDGGAPQLPARFEQVYTHAPPTVTITAAAMATRDETMKIEVEAYDGERLLDLYMFVGARKLYYQSNREGADPRRASFAFEAPLRPGINYISVVARETPDTTTRRTIVVRRDAPDGAILATPKHADDYLLQAVP